MNNLVQYLGATKLKLIMICLYRFIFYFFRVVCSKMEKWRSSLLLILLVFSHPFIDLRTKNTLILTENCGTLNIFNFIQSLGLYYKNNLSVIANHLESDVLYMDHNLQQLSCHLKWSLWHPHLYYWKIMLYIFFKKCLYVHWRK